MYSRRRDRLELVVIAVALGVLVALPIVYVAEFPGRAKGPKLPPPGIPVNATVGLGPYVGTHYANPFYAVVFGDDNTPGPLLQEQGAFLNSTPITWFRFGGNGSTYDPTTGIDYAAPSGGGTYVPTDNTLWNLTWFKSWCDSRTPGCLWLGYLPAEENNTTAAVHAAEWYHAQLGFSPQLWQLGNEPSSWTHYGVNLTRWSTYDASPVTPAAYAAMARAYVDAVGTMYPLDRFVGLEAACGCDVAEAQATAGAVGDQVAAMALHIYPTSAGSSTSLTGFFSVLQSSNNLTSQIDRFAGAVVPACARCPSLPIQVGEYQSGPVPGLSPYVDTYAGAPFLAASIIQAIDANVSMFTVFDLGALFQTSRDAPTPEGLLYQRVLENMTMGADYAAPVSDEGIGGVYALEVRNGTRSALLVVDTNTTYALNLSVPASVFPTNATGSEWSWAPGAAAPTATIATDLPTLYRVPSQGILLLTNY